MTAPQPLPPYSGDTPTCPKCSHAEAYTEWKEEQRFAGLAQGDEHLLRRCARCDYEWREALHPPGSKEWS